MSTRARVEVHLLVALALLCVYAQVFEAFHSPRVEHTRVEREEHNVSKNKATKQQNKYGNCAKSKSLYK